MILFQCRMPYIISKQSFGSLFWFSGGLFFFFFLGAFIIFSIVGEIIQNAF